jgi:exosome complex component RRP42
MYVTRKLTWHCVIFLTEPQILLLSSVLSYPLPLLSLTTHLALLDARFPALKSEGDEDPMFNDDWAVSIPLYPSQAKPPVTLLVITVGSNIIFDPSKEELAVAEGVLAVSCVADGKRNSASGLRLVSIRTVDPPSRLTSSSLRSIAYSAGEIDSTTPKNTAITTRELSHARGLWAPPRGGMSRSILHSLIKETLRTGGVAEETMNALTTIHRRV